MDFELGYHIHQHYSITRIDIFDELHFLRNLQRFALIFANIKEFIFTGKCHFFIAKFGPPKEKKNTDNNCYKQTTPTTTVTNKQHRQQLLQTNNNHCKL